MNEDDDDFFKDDETSDAGNSSDGPDIDPNPWQVLIVDDEPDIYQVTKLALRDFSFLGRGISLIRAESAEEAKRQIDQNPDIALILLDVVMESDHAGLDFARWLRDDRGILDTRIILRTGQPGQAPERQVILGYDINDYKAKSELTADRLFTSVVAALRGYQDLQENEKLREEFAARMDEQGRAERALVEILPFPVLQTDSMGQITGANALLSALTQAESPDFLIGMSAAEWLPPPLVSALHGESGAKVELAGKSFHVLRQNFGDDPEHSLGAVLCLVPESTGG